jgi:D-alanyl-D-alanine carboxypeptidase
VIKATILVNERNEGFMSHYPWRRFALACSLLAAAQGYSSWTAHSEPAFAAKLRPLILEAMKDWVTPGVIVLVDVPGQDSWIEGFGTTDTATRAPMSASNHHRIGSVTKTLTGEATLLLVDEGKIGLDDTVEQYLPGLVPNGHAITIRQMMNMTSGIYNGTEDPQLNAVIDAKPKTIWTPLEFIALSVKHPPYFPPGAGFHYSNTNYELLGLIVEKQSGTALDVFMKDRIFKPLGMTSTILPKTDNPAMPSPHGHGYFFGTNVAGMKAYDALLAGNVKDAIVPWPAGKPPIDATEFSTSYAWASGSAISTISDMKIWAKALATGSLLKPETQLQRLTWSPHAHYGLGITQSTGKFLGHNGAIPGYQTLIGYEPHTGVTIVVFANNQLEPNTNFVLPADTIGGILQKALVP